MANPTGPPPRPGPPPPPGRPARPVGALRRGARAITRGASRGGTVSARLVGRSSKATARRFRQFTTADGAEESGLSRLTELHAVNVIGDAALTVSLAGTVFALPTDEARGKVTLFLALTMAPFVILAPLIGPLLDRFRHGRRWAIGTTLATRAFLSWVLASVVVDGSIWLFPAALGALVAAKSYAVTRAAAVPRLLPDGITLVKANSRLTLAGILGMMIGGGAAGALAKVGPDWSLRFAFVAYIVATVQAIRLPDRVDSAAGERDFGHAPEAGTTRRRRLRALPVSVRYVLWLVTGARMLSGFLTLFLAFLMREHPLPGMAGSLVLAIVVGTAGAGNTAGSLVGNRRHNPPPDVLATALAVLALVAAGATTFFYSIWTLAALGFVAGLFGQLGKLSLDASIQRDVDDHTRARVFAWSETLLQTFWVVGGAIGIAIPLRPSLGFAVVTALILGAVLAALRSRATASPGPTASSSPGPQPTLRRTA